MGTYYLIQQKLNHNQISDVQQNKENLTLRVNQSLGLTYIDVMEEKTFRIVDPSV